MCLQKSYHILTQQNGNPIHSSCCCISYKVLDTTPLDDIPSHFCLYPLRHYYDDPLEPLQLDSAGPSIQPSSPVLSSWLQPPANDYIPEPPSPLMSIRSHPSRPRRLSDVEDDSDSDAAGA